MASEWSDGVTPTDSGEVGQVDAELRELEDELCRLPGVLAVRVVGDRNARPVEVHVLADQSKPAKQTVRDVRAVAQTMFGIELDHRIVSVAQLDAESGTGAGTEIASDAGTTVPRARVGRVHFEAEGVRAQVRVVLVEGDRELAGYSDGSVAAVARPQLVASATLDAIRQGDAAAEAVHIVSADITRVGPTRVAVVTVVYVEPPIELFVSGSAIVRQDRDEAVARAVLDATNRRLGRTEPAR
jgi:hypothetical protein